MCWHLVIGGPRVAAGSTVLLHVQAGGSVAMQWRSCTSDDGVALVCTGVALCFDVFFGCRVLVRGDQHVERPRWPTCCIVGRCVGVV
jgi:hypothetical protein